MMNGLMPQCATCPAFNPLPDAEGGTLTEAAIRRGECRMRPPVAHILVIPNAGGVGKIMPMNSSAAVMAQTVFPVVMSDAWCCFHPGALIGGGLIKAFSALDG